MITKPSRLFAVVLLSLPAFSLQAADTGWYLGLSAGTATDDTLNEDQTGYKFLGGYRFSDYLSGEIAYVDFGKFFNDTVDRAGVAFQGMGIYPATDHIDIFAKLGIYQWTVEIDLNPGTLKADGGDVTYGVGAQYNFDQSLGIRAEYEEYLDVNDLDVSLLTLGLLYRF